MQSRILFATCILAVAAITPASVDAQRTANVVDFALEPQDLDRALTAVGQQTGREIIVAAAAASGKRAPRLVGRFSADEAIRRLLIGSGLFADFRPDVVFVRGVPGDRPIAAADHDGSDILVTGTRIRGGTSPSPVLTRTARQIREAGQADLGDVARSLPQNFGGGQNPEVGVGAPRGSQNVNSASGLNLRGLGADATLTLLNGHRLAYDGAAQAVDISAIPLAAVERLEIVPDGSSALYGSDAVGGVANVILKRDFRGVAASARVDVATEGGGTQQRYTGTAGTTWHGGGGFATVEFDHDDPIFARQRDVTSTLAPTTTIIRRQTHRSALVNVHQQLGSAVTFEADAIYSARRDFGQVPYTPAGTVSDFGNTNFTSTHSFTVAPRLVADIASDWQLTVQGLYSRDRIRYDTVNYFGGSVAARYAGCICSRLSSIEASIEGALFELPGGAARLAAGGGVRRAGFQYTQDGTALDFDRTRTTSFAFGELSLPVVGPRNGVSGLRQLLLSAAGRYERYSHTKGVLSPKLGAVYTPVAGIALKGTWGRSFKTPTLNEQYSASYFSVINASDLGLTSYPAGSTIAISSGGNPALKPERATTWSATLEVAPPTIPGARVSVSYFDVNFINRVQVPIQSFFGALNNPIYAPFITYSPTPSQVDAAIAAATTGLENVTGRAFDPTEIAAILDFGFRNVSREHAAGIDLSAGYKAQMSARGTLDLSLDGSYLTSRRNLVPGAATLQLAGTLFNPAHWRARGGAVWSTPRLTFATFVNFVDGVTDRRMMPSLDVRGQTTVDFTARWKIAARGWLARTELGVSVRNAFNRMPARTASSFVYATPYDSTNYSVVGRLIGLEVSGRW